MGADSWWKEAACIGVDETVFFPVRKKKFSVDAANVCGNCPVLDECLDFALEFKPATGIWGGYYFNLGKPVFNIFDNLISIRERSGRVFVDPREV